MDSPSHDEYVTSSPEETRDVPPKRSSYDNNNDSPRSPRATRDAFDGRIDVLFELLDSSAPGGRKIEWASFLQILSAKAKKNISDDREKTTQIRFLVSNTAAGSIIEKGGSTINEFQSQSGARIQLSRTQEYFPGTSDRIIMVSGMYNDILKAMEMIIEKLLKEAEESNDVESRSKVRLVVPNSSCGGIIGKGGSTIKLIIEESQADVKVSPQEHNYVGVNDRLVTVTGTFDQQMTAISLILSKLLEDSHYPQSLTSPFTYGGSGGYPGIPGGYAMPSPAYNTNYGSSGYGGRYPNKGRSPSGSSESHSVTIGVADEHIGAVVGRAGRNIMEITQASGARIKISDRGDFIFGTNDRKVTIAGDAEGIRIAEDMIMQKVSANSERDQ